MRRIVAVLAVILGVMFTATAGANNTLLNHWPRYTTGPAQITVVPSTDLGYALDPEYIQWVQLAVNNWNESSKVHLTLAAPAPCYYTEKNLCVMGQYDSRVGLGGWANYFAHDYLYSHVIGWAQATVNTNSIHTWEDPFWQAMIFCHEIGEAIGLPDPSDNPVTPTVDPSCLTRDYSRMTSFPGAFNYAELDTLYANIDPPPPPPCTRKNKRACK